MDSSLGFGSAAYCYIRAYHTRFRYASTNNWLRLNSKRQLAGSFFNRHEITQQVGSLGLFANSFKFYFTGRPALLFTFPSRYLCTIGFKLYLALEDGSPRFPRSICTVVLRILLELCLISCTRLSLSMVDHSRSFHYLTKSHIGVLQPPPNPEGLSEFGLLPFRSPLLR